MAVFGSSSGDHTWVWILLSCFAAALVVVAVSSKAKSLYLSRDLVSGLYNAHQFMFANFDFMTRVRKSMRHDNLVRYPIGWRYLYLATGPNSTKSMFGRELMQQVTNQESMTDFALPTLYRMNRDEVSRWKADVSGVAKTPLPGSEGIPSRHRLWYTHEHIHAEYLGKSQHLQPMVKVFAQCLEAALAKYPIDEWVDVSIRDVCRYDIGGPAVCALFGTGLVDLYPDFMERFWNFDQHAFRLIVGVPKWIDSAPYRAHDSLLAAIMGWMDNILPRLDLESHENREWEPLLGSRMVRELIHWMRDTQWRQHTIAASLSALTFGNNKSLSSNSIPTTIWMLMEIIKDPSLLDAIREEVATASKMDVKTGEKSLDVQKILRLPLLQSVWTETLRLRINFNITRDVKRDIIIDGTLVPKGSILQAPMMISHYRESVWGAPGHGASEFWAERHVKRMDGTREGTQRTINTRQDSKKIYAMAPGTNSSFFPFGGGAGICPGRHFAKSEVLIAVGFILSSFDIQLVEWTQVDGTSSERAAQSDLRYCGAGAMPPDRDMKVRWRRRRSKLSLF